MLANWRKQDLNLQSDDIPRCQTVYVHPFSPLTGGYLTIPFLSFLQFSCFLLFLPQKYNILFVFQIKLGKNTIFLLSRSQPSNISSYGLYLFLYWSVYLYSFRALLVLGVDTNWKVRCILIEKSSIHNLLQNYYKFKIFIYLVSFFVFP